jgi:hypothetical protein
MGRIVIACYRPKPGKKAALQSLILDHVATLRAEGLVTEREPITMEAQDGTIVEVFEWVSSAAIESAHINAAVLKMWDQYTEVCDYVPVAEVPEAANMFAEFAPIEGVRHTLPGQAKPAATAARPTASAKPATRPAPKPPAPSRPAARKAPAGKARPGAKARSR